MVSRLKGLYSSSKEFIDVLVFFILFPVVLFQKSSFKLKKQSTITVINILGNGPSAHESYRNSNRNFEKLMCVNYFALTKEFLIYKPDYYTIIDPVFFLDSCSDKNLKLMNIINTVDWKLKLLVPSRYKNQINKVIKNKNVSIVYLRFNYLPGTNWFVHKLYLRNLATPKFQNVIIACIYGALNHGFTKIKLHGVEANEFTSFIVNEKNEVLLKTSHSYGSATRNLTEEGAVKPGEFWKHLNYYSLMLKGFSQVSFYARFLNAEVLNYTKESYIDSFKKVIILDS